MGPVLFRNKFTLSALILEKWNETKYIISCSFNVVLKRFGQVVSPYVLTFIILRTEAGTEAVHRCTLGRFRGPNSSMVKEDFHPKNRPNRPFFYSLVKIGNSRCSTDIERPKNPINNLQGSPRPCCTSARAPKNKSSSLLTCKTWEASPDDTPSFTCYLTRRRR